MSPDLFWWKFRLTFFQTLQFVETRDELGDQNLPAQTVAQTLYTKLH